MAWLPSSQLEAMKDKFEYIFAPNFHISFRDGNNLTWNFILKLKDLKKFHEVKSILKTR